MAEGPATLREQQLALTRHLREPDTVAAPPGMDERRLAIYRDLLFNNIQGLLAGNFPVVHGVLGPEGWRALVRDFYRDHRCQTPLFPEIAREFLHYLESRPPGDPPFLLELAHYEWVELALQIHQLQDDAQLPAMPAGQPVQAPAALLDCAPVLSPLAWPLAYRWPVHRIAPGFLPTHPPDAPTLLLLRRAPDGTVRFSELTPLAFRLVQRIEASPGDSGHRHLTALAEEAGASDVDRFVNEGLKLLLQLEQTGVLSGTVTPDSP